jgi:non-specific serine/threonine protein kinase
VKEQKVLQRLSVFAGGVTLDAAESVCAGDGVEPDEILEMISCLVDKSLVTVNRPEWGETRYRLLETIRAYALEKLAESQQMASIKNRHLEYVLQLVEEMDAKLRGPEQTNLYEKLEEEHDNLRAALGWALESHNADAGLRLASGLSFFRAVCGFLKEGIAWLEKALEQREAASAVSIANALKNLGVLLMTSEGRDFDQIAQLLEESLKLYQELEDKDGIAGVLNLLGLHAIQQEEYTKAKQFLNESLALRREIGDPWGIAHTLQNFAPIAFKQHDYESAKEYTKETITWFKYAGDQRGVARTLVDLAEVARIEGDSAHAVILLTQSLSQVLQFGDKWSAAYVLEDLAALANEQGNPKRAARLFGAAESLREAINMPLLTSEHETYEENVKAVRENMSELAFTQAWAEGCAMTLEQAVEYVSHELGSSSPPKTEKEKYGGLTTREREAAVLIAQGMSNREIAEAMTLSTKTVETYVTRILQKLGFDSRVQVATWAIENDLR